MRTPRPRTELDDLRMPVQVRLAAAWTSFMFLYAYVDYLHLYKPGSIEEILTGVVHDFDTGPASSAVPSRSWPSRSS
jgi:hypothetical protein